MATGASSIQPVTLKELTSMLQQQPAPFHWVYADEGLLRRTAAGMPVKRGGRGRVLLGLIQAARPIRLHWLLLWLVGLAGLCRMLLQQSNAGLQSSTSMLQAPFRIFVGFGAGSEEQLFLHFCSRNSSPVLRMNHNSPESFAQWHRVSIGEALSALAYALAAVKEAMKSLPAALESLECDFLTFAGMRIADYSYMRAWFGWLKAKADFKTGEIAFVAADTCAFAVSDLQLHPAFLQHGLMFYGVMPGFARIEVLTADELDFFREVLPAAELSLQRQDVRLAIKDLSDTVMIASIYGEPDYLAQINPFLQWAETEGFRLCVRPHPVEDRRLWTGRNFNEKLVLDDTDKSFLQAMERLRPRLVVSWFSTVLADVLEIGVIPVTICREDDRFITDMIYPLFKRCLRWPHDGKVIKRLMHDDEYYTTVLASLRKSAWVSQ